MLADALEKHPKVVVDAHSNPPAGHTDLQTEWMTKASRMTSRRGMLRYLQEPNYAISPGYSCQPSMECQPGMLINEA